MLRLADAWGANNAEGAVPLGVSKSTWDRVKAGTWDKILSQDQLTRASALIGVFKGLHLLFADGMADRWPKPAVGSPAKEMNERRLPRSRPNDAIVYDGFAAVFLTAGESLDVTPVPNSSAAIGLLS